MPAQCPGTGHDVAAATDASLLAGQAAGRDKLLDLGGVDGHPVQFAVAEPEDTRVTDVEHGDVVAAPTFTRHSPVTVVPMVG